MVMDNPLKEKMNYEDYIELLRLLEHGQCDSPDRIVNLVCGIHDTSEFRRFRQDEFITTTVYNEFGTCPPYAILANACIIITRINVVIFGTRFSGVTIYPGTNVAGPDLSVPMHSHMFQLIKDLARMEWRNE